MARYAREMKTRPFLSSSRCHPIQNGGEGMAIIGVPLQLRREHKAFPGSSP
jgi:hypothetical protein